MFAILRKLILEHPMKHEHDNYELSRDDYDDTLNFSKNTTNVRLFVVILFSFLAVVGSGSVAWGDFVVAPSRGAGFFDDLATSATRNADSTKLVLGKWSTTGQSYQNVAAHLKATYFKLDNWRELEKTLSGKELWKINEAFLRQQIKQGKQIILSHDPSKATRFFKNEVDFLSNFYRFEKDGWVWKAIPK